MSHIHIPFNRPCWHGDEIKYITQAYENGWISGDGPFTKKAQHLLEQQLNISKVLLTTSCTDALEMAAILLNLQPDDEVIVPSFTFVSTALAFVMRGAKIIFADIRPDTLNMDETQLESLITDKTKAIIPVHYAGIACAMDNIMAIANSYHLAVIEDNAHGLYGKYKGQALGSIGHLATQSFHETKNITCGEGGALLINDPQYLQRAEIIREKGTNRSQFFRGEINKYSWVDKGSSYVLSDILAALLYGQLLHSHHIQEKRKKLWHYYHSHLISWATHHHIQLPFIPDECESGYHMFYLLMPSLSIRTQFIAHLKNYNIHAVFHYLPLHTSKMGQLHATQKKTCPITVDISDRIVRLPFYNDLQQQELDYILDAIFAFTID